MKTLFAFLLSTLLMACAAKPTHILVDPAVSAPRSSIGSGVEINLQVSGDPSLSALGEKQSRFPLKRSVSEAAKEKLTRELSSLGFSIAPYATRQLNVSLIKAEHTITDGTLKDEISASVTMHFEAITEYGTLTRHFTDNRAQEVGGTATLGEASGVLNLSFGHVLGRALSDPELLQFLSKQ